MNSNGYAGSSHDLEMAPLRASAEHTRSGSRRHANGDARRPHKQASDDSLRTSSDDIPWATSDDAPWVDNDATPKPFTTYPESYDDNSPLTATNNGRTRGQERIPGSYDARYPLRGGRLAHIRHIVWPQVKGIVIEVRRSLLRAEMDADVPLAFFDLVPFFPSLIPFFPSLPQPFNYCALYYSPPPPSSSPRSACSSRASSSTAPRASRPCSASTS